MGYKCSVAKCKSGYASANSPTTKKISFFAFPKNNDLRNAWTRACHRQGFEPTEHSRICSLHFEESDFEVFSSDTVLSRRLKHRVLKQRKLKPDAVPRIHPNLPQRMQSLKTTPRSTTTATVTARQARQNERYAQLAAKNLSSECVSNFSEFLTKIKTASLPSQYFPIFDENYAVFLLIANVEDTESQPTVKASVKILSSMEFTIFVDGVKMSNSKFQHLLKTNERISSVTEVSNILALVKSLTETSAPTESDELLRFLERFQNDPEDKFLSFVIEQLKIRSVSKTGRRFSPNLIVLAFIWHSLSPALYRKLREFFSLPTERRLQQLSSRNEVSLNDMDMEYISSRTKNLSNRDRIVTLIIDEIYTAARIELHNGRFIGMTEDGNVGKTVLAFMVESLTSKYRDVVKLIAVDSLSSQQLRRYFDILLSSLDEYVFVIAVLVDNHAVNR